MKTDLGDFIISCFTWVMNAFAIAFLALGAAAEAFGFFTPDLKEYLLIVGLILGLAGASMWMMFHKGPAIETLKKDLGK